MVRPFVTVQNTVESHYSKYSCEKIPIILTEKQGKIEKMIMKKHTCFIKERS